MMEQAEDVMMTSEVGDDQAGRRATRTRSFRYGGVPDHAAHEMP